MNNNKLDESKSNGNGHMIIHFIYVVIILVAIIITISTCRLSDNQQVTSIISFAGTVTSIILSVLAIFITVLSNDSMSGLMEKIRSLTDAIRPAEEYMKQASDKIENTISGLETVRGELKDASSKIQLASGSIEKLSKELSENVCGKIEEKMTELRAAVQHKTDTKNEEVCELNVKQYIKNISYSGLLILYALELCEKQHKIFQVEQFSSTILKYASVDYILGFLVASYSAGYIRFEYDTSYSMKSIEVNRFLSQLLLSEIKEREGVINYQKIEQVNIESFINGSPGYED